MTEADIDRINKIPLNFVLGKERSGTTLLQVMLNAHPNIVAPPESKLIMLHYKRFSKIRKWTEKHIESYCDDLFREILFKDHWNIEREELKNSLMLAKERLTYPLLCKIVFYHYAPGKDVKMFIDKNPVFYNVIPEIQRVFPDALYLNIVRDYHANIESQKHIASLNLSIADMAYRWLRANKLMTEAKGRAPQKWFTLKYEYLVQHTDSCMKDVCRFLNMPFDEKMTQAHTSKLYASFYEHKDTEDFKKFHNKLFQPISTAYIDSWKDKMSGKDIITAETIAGEYGERMYGYKIYTEKNKLKVSGVKMIKVKLKYKVVAKFFRSVLLNRMLYILIRGVLVNLKGGK